MKNFIFFYVLFYSFYQTSSGQNCQSKIIYNYVLSESKILELRQENNGNLNWVYSQINENSGVTDMVLICDSESAIFYADKPMALDNKYGYAMAMSFLEADGITYVDLKSEEKIRFLDAYGERFLIYSSLKTPKWVIHKESKNILGFNCLKATRSYTVNNPEGSVNKNATAWFTPQVSFSFGPSGYFGLPGLILEIEYNGFIVSASEVNIESLEPINLASKLGKGKKVSLEEFELIGIKIHESITNRN